MDDPLDLARVFVKTVARMFYDTEHIVVIDALAFHGALSLSDIAIVLEYGKQLKTAQRLCGRLREGGLVSVFARAELRDGAMKAITREYYYIDYRRAIDATKYRLHMLDEKIKDNAKPTQEKAEFYCPQCKDQWTTMDVLDHIDPYGRASGFLCKTCDHPLESVHTNGATEPENDDTPAKFNRQFGPLLKLMQRIDQVIIPAVEGEDAVQGAIALPRDNEINPAAKHEPVPQQNVRPTAVRGIVPQPEKIEISIATNEEYSEAQRAAEKVKMEKMSLQNQLPEWHVKSTVSDKDYVPGTAGSKPTTNGATPVAVKSESQGESKAGGSALDDYFAQLEAEKLAEQARQAAEEEEEDDEDDDEFEEVLTTPAPVNGAPEAKRPKLEPSAAPSPAVATPVSVVAPSPAGDREESDEDDEEFESVV
jgi:transcription initiation factor TFIIE subunit alpha